MSLFRRESQQELALTISAETFIRILLLVLGTVVLLTAVRKSTHALLLIFISAFLAVSLNAPVHWVGQHLPGKRRGNRALATSLSFLLVVVVLGAFLSFLVPPLVRQSQKFISAAPGIVKSARSQDSSVGKIIRRYHLETQVSKFSSQLSERLKNVTGSAFSTVSHIGSSVFAMLTIFALTFMMLVEGPYWLKFMMRLAPARHRPDIDRLLHDMYKVVKGYVNGQVTLAAIASLFITPALFLLHVSYPLALIVIIFICGLIPMVGHTIGAIIVTLVALLHSPSSAIIILAYYILYQQVENYLIQPRIQANSTNLSPLLVFTSVVIGVSFNGLLGGLVAIPLMGCLRILVLYYLESEHKLTKQEVTKALDPEPKKA